MHYVLCPIVMFGKLAVNESARQWEYRLEMSLGHYPKALLRMRKNGV